MLTLLYADDEDCKWKGEMYYGHLEYCSLDEILNDWLERIKEDDRKYFNSEIQFIKENVK